MRMASDDCWRQAEPLFYATSMSAAFYRILTNTFWPELKAVSRIRVSQVCIQFGDAGGIVVIAV